MTVDEQMETLRKAQQHYERDIREETAMGENCYTPVEKKDEYASKATAGTALGFGIGSTVLTLLQQNGADQEDAGQNFDDRKNDFKHGFVSSEIVPYFCIRTPRGRYTRI